MAREMANGILSEKEKEKATSRCEMDQYWNDRDEVLKRLEEYRREKQSDIDLFKRIKYVHGYKDRKHGKEPMYPLKDDEGEVFRDEVESDNYEKKEDAKAEEEKEEVQDAVAEVPSSGIAQVEISEAPSEVLLVQTSVDAAVARNGLSCLVLSSLYCE